MQKTLAICLWVFIALSSTNVLAQFTVMEDFRGGGNPDIILGNSATLTSGVADPLNQGWLRLTRTTTNSKGYAFIDKSFPSSLGVLVDFEYKTWRDVNDNTYRGADGLSIFLFDGTVDKNSFVLGGDGGSLGYSKKDAIPGLYKGYIGIGFDEYGNFANPDDGAKPGGPGERPNSVVLRGPTTSNATTNRYLLGKTIIPNGTGFLYQDITTTTGLRTDDVIDFNANTSTRPTDNQFYRRVQIEIEPLANGSYNIIVRWKTKPTDTTFSEILSYETTDIPPGLLKVGFAAATGGGVNYHEIRNLLVTTPNNIRVVKRADKEILSKVSGTGTENQITYTIEVTNATNSTSNVPNINFLDGLRDADGVLIPRSNGTTTGFYIDPTITATGFISASLTASSTTSEITGTLALAPNATGIITVKGKLIGMIPQGNLLINTVTVTPPAGFDDDLNNNTYKVETPVISENVDLVLNKIDLDNACVGTSTTPKSFELRVANVGTIAATYRRIGRIGQRIVVTKTVPTSYNYDDSATPNGFTTDGTARWSRYETTSGTNKTYTYVARYPSGNSDQTLAAGATYETTSPIKYTINIPPGVNYKDEADVSYRLATSSSTGYNGGSAEVASNRSNNTASSWIYAMPSTPGVSNVFYCQGETASQLTATGTYSLKWYFSETGGTASNFAPTPTTTAAGTQSYWVSQINGNCESPRALITVTIYGKPTAGVIDGDKNICNNTTPAGGITSSTNGTVTGTGNITYRWESFSAPTNIWTTIPGTSATYAPGNLTTTTRYRRTTISTNGSTVCTSDPSNEVTITVSAITTPGTITGDQNICNGGTTTALSPTGTLATGSGTLTYRWESFSAPGNTWVTAGSGASYSPGNLTTTTRYRRITIATNTVSGKTATCESIPSNEVTITVSAITTPGTITGDQNICNGGTTTALSPTGTLATGSGTLTYRWESFSAPGNTWVTAGSGASYSPGNLTTTTRYRRITIATNTVSGKTATCESIPSNEVTITVSAITTPGTITGDQNICNGGTTTALSPTGTLATGSGTLTYRWESFSAPGNTWVTAGSGASYSPGNLTTTTRYRRITIATSTVSGKTATCESLPSNEVTITVSAITTPGTIAGDQNICNGDTTTALSPTGTLATGSGTLSYRWESFSAPGNTWVTAGSGASYSPGNLTTTTRYRRITIATSTVSGKTATCESLPSNEVVITVLPVISKGSITSGSQIICMDTKPTPLTGSTYAVTAPVASVVYRWESSPTNDISSVWTTIPGATLSNYAPPVIHKTIYYRRITIATSTTTGGVTAAVCESVPTDVVTVATKNCVVITNPMIYQRVN
ncbi:D-mannose binding lectin [compost metagenome]